MKFKDFLLSLKTMVFSDDEALCVVDLLKEKSGAIKDALKQVSIAFDYGTVFQMRGAIVIISYSVFNALIVTSKCSGMF